MLSLSPSPSPSDTGTHAPTHPFRIKHQVEQAPEGMVPLFPVCALFFKRLPQKVPSLPFPYLKMRLELALDSAPGPGQLRVFTAEPFSTD